MYGLSNKIIKEIINIRQKYGVEVLIFGSRARGDYKSSSDIDIAIKTKVDRETKYGIMNDFDKLDIIYKIDLVFIQNVNNNEFLESIIKEGKEI